MYSNFEIDTSNKTSDTGNKKNKTVTFKEWKSNNDDRVKLCNQQKDNKDKAINRSIKNGGVDFTFLKSKNDTYLAGCSNNSATHYLFSHNLFKSFYDGYDEEYERCTNEEAEQIFNKVGFLELRKCKDNEYDFMNGGAANPKNIKKHTDVLLYKVPGLEKPIEIDANDSIAISPSGKILWCHGVAENRDVKNKFNDIDVHVNLENNQHQFCFNENGTLQNLSFYGEPPKICGIDSISTGKRPKYEIITEKDDKNNNTNDCTSFVEEKKPDDLNIINVNKFKFVVQNGKKILGETIQNYNSNLKGNKLAEIECLKIDDDNFQLSFWNDQGILVQKIVNKQGKEVGLPLQLKDVFVQYCARFGILFDNLTVKTDGSGYYFVDVHLTIDNIDGFNIDGNKKASFIITKKQNMIAQYFELRKEDFPIQCKKNQDIKRVVYHKQFGNNKITRTISFYNSKNELVRVDEINNKEEYEDKMKKEMEQLNHKEIIDKNFRKKELDVIEWKNDYIIKKSDNELFVKNSTTKIKLPLNINNYQLKCIVYKKPKQEKKQRLSNHVFKENKCLTKKKNITSNCHYKCRNKVAEKNLI